MATDFHWKEFDKDSCPWLPGICSVVRMRNEMTTPLHRAGVTYISRFQFFSLLYVFR